jgi:hypothetical protein
LYSKEFRVATDLLGNVYTEEWIRLDIEMHEDDVRMRWGYRGMVQRSISVAWMECTKKTRDSRLVRELSTIKEQRVVADMKE